MYQTCFPQQQIHNNKQKNMNASPNLISCHWKPSMERENKRNYVQNSKVFKHGGVSVCGWRSLKRKYKFLYHRIFQPTTLFIVTIYTTFHYNIWYTAAKICFDMSWQINILILSCFSLACPLKNWGYITGHKTCPENVSNMSEDMLT